MKAQTEKTSDIENIGPSSRRFSFKLSAMAGGRLSESVLTDSSGNDENMGKLSIECGACEVHQSDMCCVTCEDTDLGQKMVHLDDAGSTCVDRLVNERAKVRCLIQYSHLAISDLHAYLDRIAANLTEINKTILERSVDNQDEDVRVFAETTLTDTENEQRAETERVMDKIGEFENFVASAKSLAIVCEKLNNVPDGETVSGKASSMLTRIGTLAESLPEFLEERVIYILTPSKQNGDLSAKDVVGEFVKVNVPWRIEVKRTAILRPDIPFNSKFVTTMCPATDGSVWVVWHWGPHIYLIDQSGTVKKTIDPGSKLDDICLDSQGRLVASCHADRCIKIIDPDTSEIKQEIKTEKVPRGVDCASDSEIVACCVQNLHHRNGDKSGVMRIKTDSLDEHTNKKGLTSSDHFIQPWRIAKNNNGDTCVSDRNKGAVLIFENNGELKATYKGLEAATRHPFAPHGICCDRYGQILVVDYANHTVHVLDPMGRFRGFLIMDTELEKRAIFMGTSSPFSITIDNGGDVWIGNKFGYLTVLKYVS